MQWERSLRHFPLSQIVLNYQMHGQIPKFATRDFVIDKVEHIDIPTACEIALEALEDSQRGIDLRLQYSTALYSEQDMERFFDNFATFMTSLIQDHRQPIDEVDMCGPEELQNLKENYWHMAYSANAWDEMPVIDKILQVADTNPHAPAVQMINGQNMSYKQMVEQAHHVAASLQKLVS